MTAFCFAPWADIILKQVSPWIFPRDPPPGTFRAGNVICLLDFGMVGVVDRQTRRCSSAGGQRRAPQAGPPRFSFS
jgi:hypothetical protein